jgi:hypothetical protein
MGVKAPAAKRGRPKTAAAPPALFVTGQLARPALERTLA